MTTRTATAKGIDRPHREQAPKKGIGSTLANAKSISTEQSGHNPKVGAGLPSTYFGNSRASGGARGQYGKDK